MESLTNVNTFVLFLNKGGQSLLDYAQNVHAETFAIEEHIRFGYKENSLFVYVD
jgi:hypothetical protein